MPHTAGVRAAKTGRHSVPLLVSSTRHPAALVQASMRLSRTFPSRSSLLKLPLGAERRFAPAYAPASMDATTCTVPPLSTQPSCSGGENRLYRISPALNFSACSSNIKRTALPWAVAQPEVTSAGSNCRAAARLPRGNRASSRKRKCRRA